MPIRVAHSQNPDVQACVNELAATLGTDPRLVLFFASPRYDAPALASAMHRAFDGAHTIGCSTAGELVTGKALEGSVVAMSFPDDVVGEVSVALATGVSTDPRAAVDGALERFEAELGTSPRAWSREEYVGFVLTDGLSVAEESVMDRLGDATNVAFIGGSAGDELRFERTWGYADGQAASDAVVLALFRCKRPFQFVKTQSFSTTGQTLTATKVDVARRTVHEFDDKPAARAYADALGVSVSELPGRFQRNPLGLMVSETEPFVRSPQQIKDQAVVFYCKVEEGMELSVLESGDIVADTRAALARELGDLSKVQGLVNFHCILRTLQLKSNGTMDAYADLFSGVPMIGFSTYGESFVGHINQTSTILAIR